MTDPTTEAAVRWLASVAPEPHACRLEWECDPFRAMLLPAGSLWDVVLVPGRIGFPAFDVLSGLTDAPGPVLADLGGTRIGFFVPPGTADHFVGTGIRGAGRGTWVVVPCPGRSSGGMRWLVPPDGTGILNGLVTLEHALHEAAARLAEEDRQL